MLAARDSVAGARKCRGVAATAVALVVAGTFAGTASADGDSVRCGDVITEDTRLKEDLLDCPGNGLEIGADGITLDLGGHVIDGTGTGVGIQSHEKNEVKIERGTVREFGTGILLGRDSPPGPGAVRSRGNLVREVTVRDNSGPGVLLIRVDESSLERNTLIRNGLSGLGAPCPRCTTGDAAIRLQHSTRNGVVENKVVDNLEGVLLLGSVTNNLLLENRVISNQRFGIAVGLTIPSALFPVSGDNRIAENTALGNGTGGIFVNSSGGDVVERNRSHLNGDDGIEVQCRREALCASRRPTVARNAANRNGDLGIFADPGWRDGGHNKARRNGNPAQCVGVACS